MIGRLKKLFKVHDDEGHDGGMDSPDDRACSISGHDYSGQWRLYGYFARTSGGFNRRKFRVRKKEVASCSKCGKAETREKVIGYVRVTKNDELELVD